MTMTKQAHLISTFQDYVTDDISAPADDPKRLVYKETCCAVQSFSAQLAAVVPW